MTCLNRLEKYASLGMPGRRASSRSIWFETDDENKRFQTNGDSERKLSERLSVGRTTVRRTLSILADEGLIERRGMRMRQVAPVMKSSVVTSLSPATTSN